MIQKKNSCEKVTPVIVCAEVPFSKNQHYFITNQLTGFLMIKALFTGRYSRTDHNVFSEIPFNKSSHYIGTSQFIYIENWPVFVRHKSLLKSISEHTPQSVHKYISVKTVPQRSKLICAYGNQLTGLCMIRAHPERYFRTVIIARPFTYWTVFGTVAQQLLA